jgi:hypothetical protein
MLMPGQKSTLPEDQVLELAHKHKISANDANGFLVQLEGWMLDPTLENADDEEVSRMITRHRENAQYHTAGIILFVQAARRQKLSLFEAGDIFIGLLTPVL